MNSFDPQHPWSRLTAVARQAPAAADGEAAAPYGFSTRVVARAWAAERAPASLFERFSLRALGFASLLALASIAANYSMFTGSANEDDLSLTNEDPVTVLLEVS